MILKTDFHIHTEDDHCDIIDYSLKEAIDIKTKKGFNAMAITLHNTILDYSKFAVYAVKNNLLLIPGVELTIINDYNNSEKHHVVLLNCLSIIDFFKNDFEKINYFSKSKLNNIKFCLKRNLKLSELINYLKKYKKKENIFVFIPHPYYFSNKEKSFNILFEKLKKYLDALEYCHFYHDYYNKYNQKAKKLSLLSNKSMIANSDAHFYFQLKDVENYSLVDISKISVEKYNLLLDKLKHSNNIFENKNYIFLIKNIFFNIRKNNVKIISKSLNYIDVSKILFSIAKRNVKTYLFRK